MMRVAKTGQDAVVSAIFGAVIDAFLVGLCVASAAWQLHVGLSVWVLVDLAGAFWAGRNCLGPLRRVLGAVERGPG